MPSVDDAIARTEQAIAANRAPRPIIVTLSGGGQLWVRVERGEIEVDARRFGPGDETWTPAALRDDVTVTAAR